MADAKQLPEAVANDLARQVRRRVLAAQASPTNSFFTESVGAGATPESVSLPPAAEFTLNETFEVWRLTPALVREAAESGRDLVYVAKPTGRLHHQLKVVGDAHAYTRSKTAGEGKQVVREIVVSKLAQKIDRAIRWADRNPKLLPDTMRGHLLVSPLHQVVALWFVNKETAEGDEGGSKVLVVSASDDSRLPVMRLLDSREFVQLLRDEPVGRGLAVPPGEGGTPPDSA